MNAILLLPLALSTLAKATPTVPSPPHPPEDYGFQGIKVFFSMVITSVKFNEALLDRHSDGFRDLTSTLYKEFHEMYVVTKLDKVTLKLLEFSKDPDGVLAKMMITFDDDEFLHELYETTLTAVERDVGITGLFGYSTTVKPQSLNIHDVEKYERGSQQCCQSCSATNDSHCCAESCCQNHCGHHCCEQTTEFFCTGIIYFLVFELPDEVWVPELGDSKSEKFKELADRLSAGLMDCFNESHSIAGFDVLSFSKSYPSLNLDTGVTAKGGLKVVVPKTACSESILSGLLIHFLLEQKLLKDASLGDVTVAFPHALILYKPGIKFTVHELKPGWEATCHQESGGPVYEGGHAYKKRLSQKD